jgi:DNA-binding IclR family transcriptional regulator
MSTAALPSDLHAMVATLSELRRFSRDGIAATPTALSRAAFLRRTTTYRALEQLRDLGFAEPAQRLRRRCAAWTLTDIARGRAA